MRTHEAKPGEAGARLAYATVGSGLGRAQRHRPQPSCRPWAWRGTTKMWDVCTQTPGICKSCRTPPPALLRQQGVPRNATREARQRGPSTVPGAAVDLGSGESSGHWARAKTKPPGACTSRTECRTQRPVRRPRRQEGLRGCGEHREARQRGRIVPAAAPAGRTHVRPRSGPGARWVDVCAEQPPCRLRSGGRIRGAAAYAAVRWEDGGQRRQWGDV